jgi:hypothetical protein
MREKPYVRPRLDPYVYAKNRSSHSIEELARYGDEWVAWSLDGLRVVAHHADPLQVAPMLEAQGLSTEDVNFEWIPPGGFVETLLYAFSSHAVEEPPLARRSRSVPASSRL